MNMASFISSMANILCFLHILGYQINLFHTHHLGKKSVKIQDVIMKRFSMDINRRDDGRLATDNGLSVFKFFNDKIRPHENPKMIYFFITGSLNLTYEDRFQKMFKGRINPNGCPISVSFFVPKQFADYDVVKYFYDYNHDIGITGSYEKAGLEYMNMAMHTDIPMKSIKGFKTESVGSFDKNTVKRMSNYGFKYLVYENCGKHRDGLRRPCVIDISKNALSENRIPRGYAHKQFEHIPFNGIFLENDLLCSSTDTFASIHYNETKLFDFLWREFERTIHEKRKPFGFYLNTDLFLNDVFYNVIQRFMTEALSKSDVYIVSIQKMMDWFHSKPDLSEVKEFKPWSCEPTFEMEVKQKTNEMKRRLGLTNTVFKSYEKMSHTKQLFNKKLNIRKNENEASESNFETDSVDRVLRDNCYQGDNCKLPSCFCPTYKHYMNVSEIPQIVYFGFDDHLNSNHRPFYDTLFNSSKRNPNGCQLSATFYVSHVATEYDVVKYYYDKGNEMGIHSVNHTLQKTRDTMLYQAGQQINNLITFAGIPRDDLQGWRSPYLETAGDIQVEVLKQLGIKYDISYLNRIFDVKLNPKNTISPSPSLWPFTLDSGGLPFTCVFNECPKNAHDDFWIVPLTVFVDIKNKNICPMADDCKHMPKNAEEVYEYVWNNFKVNYYGNRAPFGLHLHPSWFLKNNFSLNGLDKFIHEVLKLKDVYIVSVKKMLDWVKYPTRLDKLNMFKPWKC